jgi:hypothetical protein
MELLPQNALSYDLDSETLHIDAPTKIGDVPGGDYLDFEDDGAVVFNGAAALACGEISAQNVADTITISGTGQANKVQVTSFDTNGPSKNMTPDHTNDHITVDKAGLYLCTISIAAESAAGAGFKAGFSLWKNNGTTEFGNLHAHRNLSGGGGDFGSITMSGIVQLEVGDTIEIWTWNETNTVDIVVDDITLSLLQIGGAQ